MAPRIQRYTFGERLLHAASGLSYVYLLLTGLAFWTPALFWLAVALGGGYLSRLLHPWIGLLFSISVGWMWVAWRRDMRLTPEDHMWRKAMGHYARNEDEQVPPAWRFNYGQKMLFWLMFAGGVVLLASGLVLWNVETMPWSLQAVRSGAALAHGVAALATIGGFIIHVYMGIFVVPEGLSAVIHGEVSGAWARRHHPLWHGPAAPRDDRRRG